MPHDLRRRRPNRPLFYAASAVALLLLLAMIVAPWVNVGRFRRRIAQSISEGLGRPVHVGSVSFRIFPQPAFLLNNFSVAEDPAFGAEPVLTADSVTAVLRASTLWHRHVDVATLSFDNPSLNLVRNAAGKWDVDSILRRASTPQATQPQPFPYVEATGARINFKFGNEKQPFSLMDADLALWKESTGQWRMRLKARPARTDQDGTDTGQLRANATLQYASDSGNAPITAHAEWSKVHLGVISHLFLGKDTGWRGAVDMTADAKGTLAAMDIATSMRVDGFRREEFIPPSEMGWQLKCIAHFDRALALFSPIACDAPLGTGDMHLAGRVSLLPQGSIAPGSAPSNLRLTLHQVPASFLLDVARHVHAGIPAQASATGDLSGQLDCGEIAVSTLNPCTGKLHAGHWTLTLPGMPEPLVFSSLDIARPSSAKPRAAGIARRSMPVNKSFPREQPPALNTSVTGFVLAPVHVALGAPASATVTGTLGSDGYKLALSGPATLEYLLPVARSLGLTAVPPQIQSAHGDAQLALALQGSWLPAQTNATTDLPPSHTWDGEVQLRDARVGLKDWPGRILFSSATLQLAPDAVIWNNIHGSYQKETFDGSFRYVTTAITNSSPARTFHFHVDSLNAGHLQSSILSAGSRPWRLLGLVDRWIGNTPSLPRIAGQIFADRLTVGMLTVKDAAVTLQLAGRKATVSKITGNAFGGTLDGDGSIEWTTGTPAYQARLTFHGIQPNAVAALFHAHPPGPLPWGRGSANLNLDLKTHGITTADLAQQTRASYTSQWKSGGWDAPALMKTPLARFDQLILRGQVQNQVVRIVSGSLSAGQHTQPVAGTISFQGQTNLYLQSSQLQIKGTLAHPVVRSIPQKGGKEGVQ